MNDKRDASPEAIAIIGIGCRFPGRANSPARFWQLLSNGVDAISEVPKDRFNVDAIWDPEPPKPGKVASRWGGFVEDISDFDAEFFGVSPREAARMDPQQRLLLEVAYQALEDAGQQLDSLAGSDTGVFVGISTCDYGGVQGADRKEIDAYTNLGLGFCISANRISYLFDFHGPSFAVDTACSSSMVATHLACQNIWDGRCGMALVGGVNAILRPEGTIGFSQASMLSPDGRCKSFEARANGYVRAEGAGMVVLKPLARALADKDPIYALIRGTAINQDGRTMGIALPSDQAQAALLRAVYEEAGVPPEQVHYVEAHGTGTLVGDPAEAASLGEVLGRDRRRGDALVIGSVKTNIGHLEAGSGVAGLIKAALCLKHQQIPPNLHFQKPNPEIPFERLNLRVAQSLEPWPDDGRTPRFAGVNSFGFGGTNAHAILEGYSEPAAPLSSNGGGESFSIGLGFRRKLNDRKVTRGLRAVLKEHGIALSREASVSIEEQGNRWRIVDGSRKHTVHRTDRHLDVCTSSGNGKSSEAAGKGRATLVPLSARSREALNALAQAYVDWLGAEGADVPLEDVAYTASHRRTHHDYRLTLVARSNKGLAEHLRVFLDEESRLTTFSGRAAPGPAPKLAFVFSGMGPQWWAMGRELLEDEPVFRDVVLECDELLGRHADWSLWSQLTADEESSRIHEPAIAQPASFALQAGLAALWRSWGVVPDAIVGHSVGEVVAAHVAGALTLEDAVSVVFHRSRLQQRTSGEGRMLAVGLSPEEAAAVLAGHEDRVSLAAVNSPTDVTLSGDAQALDAIADALEKKQVFCRFLQVDVPYHSPSMDALKDELLESLERIRPRQAEVPLYSTVTGGATEGPADAGYWWRNMRECVRFGAAIGQLASEDIRMFLEISAHPVLSASVAKVLAAEKKEGAIVHSLRRSEPERPTMLGALGALFTSGYPVDWSRQHPDGGRFVRLPSYPWQRETFWHETEACRRNRLDLKSHPLLGFPQESAHPSWTNTIELQPLGYLADHRVQEAVMYPAAAFVEMALAAARETFGEGPAVLEEVVLERAIVLPEGETAATHLAMDPGQNSFEIYSRREQGDKTWARNVVGKLRRLEAGAPRSIELKEVHDRCQTFVSPADFYSHFRKVSLEYGPCFQCLQQLWCGDREAVGEIRLHPDLEASSEPYLIHPTLLDASFHVVLGAAGDLAQEELRRHGIETTFLPVRIEQIRFYRRPGATLYSRACVTSFSSSHIVGDIQLCDEEGKLLAEIRGFECRAIDRAAESVDSYLYEFQWKLKRRAEKRDERRPPAGFPLPREIADAVTPEGDRLSRQMGMDRYSFMTPRIGRAVYAYLMEALAGLGCPIEPGRAVSIESLAEKIGAAAHHRRYLEQMFEWMSEYDLLRETDEGWSVVGQGETAGDPAVLWRALWNEFPGLQAELMMLRQCGEGLADVLSGRVDPLEVIFSQGSLSTAEHLYQDSPSYQIYNLLAQKSIAFAVDRLPQGRTVRLLEIGGGTGGLTSYVLPKLPADRTEYVFTDITQLLTLHAEQKFQEYPFVEYSVLDIEKDPASQGFEPHSFDIILASDVLHATRDLRETMTHVRQLLAPEGLLVLLEITTMRRWISFVFGLLPGWWRFTDSDLRRKDPWISEEAWEDVLAATGFRDVACLTNGAVTEKPFHSVILALGAAEAPGDLAEPPTAETSSDEPTGGEAAEDATTPKESGGEEAAAPDEDLPGPAGEGGFWLVFADRGGAGRQLAAALESKGDASVLVSAGSEYVETDGAYQIRPGDRAQMQRLVDRLLDGQRPCRGVVHLWSLDIAAGDELNAADLTAIQSLGSVGVMQFVQALTPPAEEGTTLDLWLVTAGAQSAGEGPPPVSVAQHPLWGASRTMANEIPRVRFTMVDFSADPSADEIDQLVQEMHSEEREAEVAFRGGARYVHRLTRMSLADVRQRVPKPESGKKERESFQVAVARPGILDSLRLEAAPRRAPEAGEVEIEVCAAALNFKDVMIAMGLLPDEALEGGFTGKALGIECSGRIVRVGKAVQGLRIGDEVITSGPGTLRSHMTVDAAFVARKPPSMSFEDAATIPIAFSTAYYCLHHLGRMQKGDRVLIHAAAGGVGLAALQLAQRAGAEVFATAGTPQKRALLKALGADHVMDSRSLAFADEIMETTGGKGVDIVLNSLAGEAIAKSVSVLSGSGRFIEIGKIDIYRNSKLGLRPFRNNLAYFAVDMDRLMAEQPDFMRSLLGEVVEHFTDEGATAAGLCPISHRVFRIAEVAQAFRYMAQAKHIGKVVVSMQDPDLVVETPRARPATFPPDKTYLVTGGLGGFGLAVAQWMAERGAEHLVLMGRSGASSAEAQSAIAALGQSGVEVHVVQGDVTREEDVASALAHVAHEMPPLGGVVHAAMVLDDAFLHELDEERLWRVVAPKMVGAWHLHRQTRHLPLDFFVLFSSFSSVWGTPKQANYVMANAFLDGLARYRHACGLPALAVNWGAAGDVGYVARNENLGEKLNQLGVRSLPAALLLKILGVLIPGQHPQVGVGLLDWQRLAKMQIAGASLFEYLVEPTRGDEGGKDGSWLIDALMAIEPDKRQEFLLSNVREHLAKVLGKSPAKVDVDKPLLNMGLDSLMAVEMGSRFESELGVTVPPVKFMEGMSASSLAAYVVAQLTDRDSSLAGPAVSRPQASPPPARRPETSPAEEVLSKVDQLSDEEVDTLLQEMIEEEVH